jgi:transketolase
VIPDDIRSAWDAQDAGAAKETAWNEKFEAYRRDFAGLAEEFERRMAGELPVNWDEKTGEVISELQSKGGDVASRKSSHIALNAFGPHLPELIGGSADLAGSNLTIWSGSVDVNEGTEEGNYIYFGVREFGMAAICNGLALHGGFIPYNSTFLVFSDYARNAVRMSALIPTHNIHVYTHDSIGLGEDGPTHQPVEHVASLRLIPGLEVWRPCDTVESAVAWKAAIENKGKPTVLVFSRQSLPHQARKPEQLADIARGAYVLRAAKGTADAIIMASGSEVGLAVAAADALASTGVEVSVVSIPNPELFQRQDRSYRESVLPDGIKARVAVEAGVTPLWVSFVGDHGRVVGIDTFGASAPAGDLFEYFGLTVENISQAVRESLAELD